MQMMYENTQDAPGNYVTCHFVVYPHKHTGCIPKCPLEEVRPRLFFCLFLTSNSVGFFGWFFGGGGIFLVWFGLVWFF